MDLQAVATNINQLGFADYILSFVIGFGIFIWAWSVLWTTKDISARTDNLGLQMVSICLVIFLTPVIGLPLYFLIRPIFYKYDRNGWRDALALNIVECKSCWNPNSLDFNNCIHCGSELKIECKECKNKYAATWGYCEKCGAPNIEAE